MRKCFLVAAIGIVVAMGVCGCGAREGGSSTDAGSGSASVHSDDMSEYGYESISQEEARELMSGDSDVVVLDVRTPEEYAGGHIPNAVNIPLDVIESATEGGVSAGLPDKDATILVYCRSGRRAKAAADMLAGYGFSHVLEFGGIQSWTGEIER